MMRGLRLACFVVLVAQLAALFSKDGKAALRGEKEPDLSSVLSSKMAKPKGVSEVKTESIFVSPDIINDPSVPTQNWKGLGYYSVNFYNGADPNQCGGTPMITEGYQTNKCLPTGKVVTSTSTSASDVSSYVMFQCIGPKFPPSKAMNGVAAASGVMVTTYASTDTTCGTPLTTTVYPTGSCTNSMGFYGSNNNQRTYAYSYMNTEDPISLQTQQQMLNTGGSPYMQAMCTLVNKASPGIPLQVPSGMSAVVESRYASNTVCSNTPTTMGPNDDDDKGVTSFSNYVGQGGNVWNANGTQWQLPDTFKAFLQAPIPAGTDIQNAVKQNKFAPYPFTKMYGIPGCSALVKDSTSNRYTKQPTPTSNFMTAHYTPDFQAVCFAPAIDRGSVNINDPKKTFTVTQPNLIQYANNPSAIFKSPGVCQNIGITYAFSTSPDAYYFSTPLTGTGNLKSTSVLDLPGVPGATNTVHSAFYTSTSAFTIAGVNTTATVSVTASSSLSPYIYGQNATMATMKCKQACTVAMPRCYQTARPTSTPTVAPSASSKTSFPSFEPSAAPTVAPSAYNPSTAPSAAPTVAPSSLPTTAPSLAPATFAPSATPTIAPMGTLPPTVAPTAKPTASPSLAPSVLPSGQPTGEPSSRPSMQPTMQPSQQPTQQPTMQPSQQPTSQPTHDPTQQPTTQPSQQPSQQPTTQPTGQPSRDPTMQPSRQPSAAPSQNKYGPKGTCPSGQPTQQPSQQPTRQPSVAPSQNKYGPKGACPSGQPTQQPSRQPTEQPTGQPSRQPTQQPSRQPSQQPTCQPTIQPSQQPTSQPSRQPTQQPSRQPTIQPSGTPTAKPTVYNKVGTTDTVNGKVLTNVGGCDAASILNCVAACSPIAPGFRIYSQSKMVNFVLPNTQSSMPSAAPVVAPPTAVTPVAVPSAAPVTAAPSSGAPFKPVFIPVPTLSPVAAAGSPTPAPTKAAIVAVTVVQPITFALAIPAASLVPGPAYTVLKGSVQASLYTTISTQLSNPTGLNVNVTSIKAVSRRRRDLLQTATTVNVNYKVTVNNPSVKSDALSTAVASPTVIASAATGATAATGVTATAATPTVTVLSAAPTAAPSAAKASAAASVRASGAATLTVGLIVGFLLTMLA